MIDAEEMSRTVRDREIEMTKMGSQPKLMQKEIHLASPSESVSESRGCSTSFVQDKLGDGKIDEHISAAHGFAHVLKTRRTVSPRFRERRINVASHQHANGPDVGDGAASFHRSIKAATVHPDPFPHGVVKRRRVCRRNHLFDETTHDDFTVRIEEKDERR